MRIKSVESLKAAQGRGGWLISILTATWEAKVRDPHLNQLKTINKGGAA
jgi:hypothetical protein